MGDHYLRCEFGDGGAVCDHGDRIVDEDVVGHIEAEARADSLDAAWADAEAALPEGWWFEVASRNKGDEAEGESRAIAIRPAIPPHPATRRMAEVWAATPAAALRALAAKLRER